MTVAGIFWFDLALGALLWVGSGAAAVIGGPDRWRANRQRRVMLIASCVCGSLLISVCLVAYLAGRAP